MPSNPWSLDKIYSNINDEEPKKRHILSDSPFNERINNQELINKGNISYVGPMTSPTISSSRGSQFSEGTFGSAGIFGS